MIFRRKGFSGGPLCDMISNGACIGVIFLAGVEGSSVSIGISLSSSGEIPHHNLYLLSKSTFTSRISCLASSFSQV